MKIAEKDREALEGAKTEAVQYRDKNLQMLIKQSWLYQLLRHESEVEAKKAEDKKEQHQKQLTYESDKLLNHEGELKATEER